MRSTLPVLEHGPHQGRNIFPSGLQALNNSEESLWADPCPEDSCLWEIDGNLGLVILLRLWTLRLLWFVL